MRFSWRFCCYTLLSVLTLVPAPFVASPSECRADSSFYRRPQRIAIIGAGASGTLLAVRLARWALLPTNIMLLERDPAQRHGGIAYSRRRATEWSYPFNVQAGRLSAFPERPYDFNDYLTFEALRKDWPERWKTQTFTVSSTVPRRIFPDYLSRRLNTAIAEAAKGVVVDQPTGEAVDAEEDHHGPRLFIENFSDASPNAGQTIRSFDTVVLATGHEEADPPEHVDGDKDVEDIISASGKPQRRINRLYTEAASQEFARLPPHATVVVYDTSFRAYDPLLQLLDQNHLGPMYLVVQEGRSGIHPPGYPKNYEHGVTYIPQPDLGALFYDPEAVVDQIYADMTVFHDGSIDDAVAYERILKGLERHIEVALRGKTVEETRGFFARMHRLSRLRVGFPADEADQVRAAMASGRIIQISDPEQISAVEQEADLIIWPIRWLHDYSQVSSPLIARLREQGLIMADPYTGRGLYNTPAGFAIGKNGPSKWLLTIGLPDEARHLRSGRTIPFSFNFAMIKRVAMQLAALILGPSIDEFALEVVASSTGTIDPSNTVAVEVLTRAFIEFFAETDHSRQQREEGLRQTLCQYRQTPDLGEVIKQARETAIGRLTDKSVTPHDLAKSLELNQ